MYTEQPEMLSDWLVAHGVNLHFPFMETGSILDMWVNLIIMLILPIVITTLGFVVYDKFKECYNKIKGCFKDSK
jgi:hypothetical protein